jgi:hypothetical protein
MSELAFIFKRDGGTPAFVPIDATAGDILRDRGSAPKIRLDTLDEHHQAIDGVSAT